MQKAAFALNSSYLVALNTAASTLFCKDKQIGLNSADQALQPEAAVLFSHRVCNWRTEPDEWVSFQCFPSIVLSRS